MENKNKSDHGVTYRAPMELKIRDFLKKSNLKKNKKTMSQFQVANPPKWFSYIKQLQKSKN